MAARIRLLAVGLLAVAVLALGGWGSAAAAGTPSDVAGAASAGQSVTPTTGNDFIPTDQNLTDCIGTLERPECGGNRDGDLNMYLTFAVLMGGMAVIGWRIALAVRKRDRSLDEHVPEHTF